MGDSMRFHEFIKEQKPSIRKLRLVRLLYEYDRSCGEIFVKDSRSLKSYLDNLVFEHSIGVVETKISQKLKG